MRFPIAALFLVATLAIAQTQNATKSSYEKDEPTKPAKQYPPQLVNDLMERPRWKTSMPIVR